MLLFRSQKAADEKVNSTDCVIRSLPQGPNEMFQVLLQVSKQERTSVWDLWVDNGRNMLNTQKIQKINANVQ